MVILIVIVARRIGPSFSAPSQVTYYMQHIVMAGVMADAAMVDGAIERDVYCRRDPAELRGG